MIQNEAVFNEGYGIKIKIEQNTLDILIKNLVTSYKNKINPNLGSS